MTYDPSGDGTAACAWTPASMQASGVRSSASRKRTCPDATNARTACDSAALKKSMCGRTGAVPVCAMQSATAAVRSIRSA